jgi:hypothetical protein
MVSRARGLWAVIYLWIGAADHYLTALFGIPPVTWIVTRLAAATRAAYRLGRHGQPSRITVLAVHVIDGQIIEENRHHG